MKGIDLSHWNIVTDWKRVKDAGIEFVILKAGGSDSGALYKDKKFEEYYAAAKAVGLKVGAYFYAGIDSYTEEAGKRDANFFWQLLKGKQFEMPVYVDYEVKTIGSKTEQSRYCIAFCDFMEDKNYYAGIYGSEISTFRDKLVLGMLTQYCLWVARYGKKPAFGGIWQTTSSGRVTGIIGRVDLDECYINYSSAIIKKGLNGYGREAYY